MTIITRNRNEIIKSMNPDLHSYHAQIKCKATSGIVKKAKEDVTETRSAGKNTTIFRTLKKRRNPVFYTDSQDNEFKSKWQEAINDFIITKSTTKFEKFAKEIADKGIEIIKENIYQGKSESGKMKALFPAYQKIKDRIYGKNLPILVRTGQLINSLFSEVKKS